MALLRELLLLLLLFYMVMIAVNFMAFFKMPDELLLEHQLRPRANNDPHTDTNVRALVCRHKSKLVGLQLGTLLPVH